VTGADRPHLPQQAPIDAYGNGGFRFAEMSHRGSLLCLPSGLWAWEVNKSADISLDALAQVWAEAETIDVLLIGTGAVMAQLPADVRVRLRELHVGCEVLTTGAAVRTYNILFGESRRVAAALIAADASAG
jgi:uncharacterized protein